MNAPWSWRRSWAARNLAKDAASTGSRAKARTVRREAGLTRADQHALIWPRKSGRQERCSRRSPAQSTTRPSAKRSGRAAPRKHAICGLCRHNTSTAAKNRTRASTATAGKSTTCPTVVPQLPIRERSCQRSHCSRYSRSWRNKASKSATFSSRTTRDFPHRADRARAKSASWLMTSLTTMAPTVSPTLATAKPWMVPRGPRAVFVTDALARLMTTAW
mmetsp:Transcript_34609/g.107768  ORF Transcript_34609/g.107768 Transcript_34609/m.107768 type:complete len:218 (-) Transcript_34609:163-816(-)